jgi:aerobic carbon-monoxide dehydrogenase large subunit
MGPFGIGQSVTRFEDFRLLRGEGRFIHDVHAAGEAYLVLVRSPHAHARIRAVDVTAARSTPGVRLVLTAADVAGEIARPIPSFSQTPPFDIRGPDGSMAPEAEQRALAAETVRYAGQPVVFVVADSLGEAQDAAERVRIDYDPLPVSFRWEGGDRAAVDVAFARCRHVTRVEVANNRIAPVFMEPRPPWPSTTGPRVADYVRGPRATREASAAAACSCCLRSYVSGAVFTVDGAYMAG